MNKIYKLIISIFSRSNIVISETVKINDYVFKSENAENFKGAIETFAQNIEEAERKL